MRSKDTLFQPSTAEYRVCASDIGVLLYASAPFHNRRLLKVRGTLRTQLPIMYPMIAASSLAWLLSSHINKPRVVKRRQAHPFQILNTDTATFLLVCHLAASSTTTMRSRITHPPPYLRDISYLSSSLSTPLSPPERILLSPDLHPLDPARAMVRVRGLCKVWNCVGLHRLPYSAPLQVSLRLRTCPSPAPPYKSSPNTFTSYNSTTVPRREKGVWIPLFSNT